MSVQIIGQGTRAAVGLSALQVAMSVRARKLEPRTLEHLKDSDGNEIGMAICAGISLTTSPFQRLVGMSVPAMLDATRAYLAEHEAQQKPVSIPLILAAPEESRPYNGAHIEEQLIGVLAERSKVPIDVDASQLVRCGHAAGAFALSAAIELLQKGGREAVLVGGVDTYCHDATLQKLDADYRLQTQSSFDGFIPGEAAGFVLLTQGAAGSHPELVGAWTGIEPAGTSEEVDDDDPVNIAETMTELVDAAVAEGAFGGAGIPWVITDINGERHRVREWSLIQVRRQITSDNCVLERLPQGVGDVGAASALVALNNACALWRARCAPANRVMIAVHAEGVERGLVVARYDAAAEEAA